MDEKACARCGEIKPYSAFGLAPRMASGRKSYCRPCYSAWGMDAYRKEDPAVRTEKRRQQYQARKARGALPPPSQRAGRLKKYGITPEQWDDLYEKQQGKCAVCGTTEPRGRGKQFHVDHDHSTGKVRGLLCTGCNVGIGHLGESVERLQKVIAYLELHAPE